MANRIFNLYNAGYTIRQIAERLDLEIEDVLMYLRLFR